MSKITINETRRCCDICAYNFGFDITNYETDTCFENNCQFIYQDLHLDFCDNCATKIREAVKRVRDSFLEWTNIELFEGEEEKIEKLRKTVKL